MSISRYLIQDEITLEDSGPCDACGRGFKLGDKFMLDEYLDDRNETVINIYHYPNCWNAAQEGVA